MALAVVGVLTVLVLLLWALPSSGVLLSADTGELSVLLLLLPPGEGRSEELTSCYIERKKEKEVKVSTDEGRCTTGRLYPKRVIMRVFCASG